MSECENAFCRRDLLQRAAGGFASIALAGILADRQATGAVPPRPTIHWPPSGRTFRRERSE